MAKTDPKVINTKLQTLLVNARKAAGLTQLDVAVRLKKPQSYVSKYETGERKLTVGDFIAVCEAIGVQAEKVLKGI